VRIYIVAKFVVNEEIYRRFAVPAERVHKRAAEAVTISAFGCEN
jgi:hypothetical protein